MWTRSLMLRSATDAPSATSWMRHDSMIRQLPGAIVIRLVSDSFRSTGLRTYRCGGSVGFAPTSHLSSTARYYASAPHRIQSGRSMTGGLRLVKLPPGIGEVFILILRKGHFSDITPPACSPGLSERLPFSLHALCCQPLHQRNCPGSRPRESLAALSLLPPCSNCHLEALSKFPRRSVAGSARRFFPVFHRLMILLLESSGAVCKIPVSSGNWLYGGIDCECEINDSGRLIDDCSHGLWLA